MNSNAAAQKRYPVTPINPEQYVPLKVFIMMWKMNRLKSSESISDAEILNPKNGNLSQFAYVVAPPMLMMSMVLLLLNAPGLSNVESLTAFFSMFSLWLMLGIFGVTLSLVFKRTKLATNEKNAGDFAVLESARQYLQNRYETVPPNWEERFVSYLVGEPVADNKFSTDYELKVRNFKGYDVLMIANVDGEAPLKSAVEEE